MTATMTMNFPAQYTVVAENEMVYLTGGSLVDVVSSMKTATNYINCILYPVYVVQYFAESALWVSSDEDGYVVKEAATMGKAVTAVGQFLRYFGSTVTQWSNYIFA